MPPLFDLSVIAPDHQVYEGRVRSLVAPGREGRFGVLPNHAPMLAELGVGELKVVDERGDTHVLATASGFLEVAYGVVIVLADAGEAAADIDVARARAAESRARERLAARILDVDQGRAAAALSRALNRLRVAAGTHQ